MKKLLVLIPCLCYALSMWAADPLTLTSGDVVIKATVAGDLRFFYKDVEIPFLNPDFPIFFEVDLGVSNAKYSSCSLRGQTLTASALVMTNEGSKFSVTDKYIAKGEGRIELQRDVSVLTIKNSYYNTFFGFRTNENATAITDDEYFVPAVWYSNNFKPNGNIPSSIPQADDRVFLYRSDRITMPMVMSRNPGNGRTVTIIHKDANPTTVMADNENTRTHAGYQYGSLGVTRNYNVVRTLFAYPGTEDSRRAGRGYRSHPLADIHRHQYNLELCFSTTDSYAQAVKESWEHAFELYNPTVYQVKLSSVYDGLIETLLHYYVPSVSLGGTRDAGGFPFEVGLDNFQARGIDYQMGFVGMQVATAYYLFREGIEKKNLSTRNKGSDVLDFWATRSLTNLGYPRAWYDPGQNGATGTFRSYTELRTITGGMESLVAAWCFAKKNNIDKPKWINACKNFGNWLVTNQNSDGSYFFAYDHNRVQGGKHPVTNDNKFLTICAVRYLVELYIATGDEKYKDAALKAGAFCYENIHNDYMYVAGVVDNKQTIDSESGQMALNGFLALYDLTKDKKWLAAAEQAATYTETWVYSYEIPAESDRTGNTSFPKDRSIVGQHIIAIGHSAADLGFAWSSFAFYRLYLETGNKHYLQVARISAHNTKQSMNWDQSLYPGRAKGLQLEAFQVMIPRRSDGIMTCLNWNYAAHLDPMFRFKDAFGMPDIETVEKLPMSERLRLNAIYREVQSANWGQEVTVGTDRPDNDAFTIYPNCIKPDSPSFTLRLPESYPAVCNLAIYNLTGRKVYSQAVGATTSITTRHLEPGYYLVRVSDGTRSATAKLSIH